jgi:hypothetical protein
MGFGHWQGEIPLTKANAGRAAKGYADRLLGVCGKTVRNAAFLPLAI